MRKLYPRCGAYRCCTIRGQVEIEIEASDRMVPQTQLLANPDRLVVDFANAVPGAQLRNQAINRAQVKSVRVGLFSAKPPVTRIVLDLNGPQRYQVFPDGRTVIVKIGSPGSEAAELNPASSPLKNSAAHPSRLGLVNTTYPTQQVRIPDPEPPPATATRSFVSRWAVVDQLE